MNVRRSSTFFGAAIALSVAFGQPSLGSPVVGNVKHNQATAAQAKRLQAKKHVNRWPVVGSNSGTFAVQLSAYECNALFGEVAADRSCKFNGKACHATKGGTTVIMCITEAD